MIRWKILRNTFLDKMPIQENKDEKSKNAHKKQQFKHMNYLQIIKCLVNVFIGGFTLLVVFTAP